MLIRISAMQRAGRRSRMVTHSPILHHTTTAKSLHKKLAFGDIFLVAERWRLVGRLWADTTASRLGLLGCCGARLPPSGRGTALVRALEPR